MSLEWFYVYSQRYEALHHMLQDSIKDPRFNVKPLFVDQSEFTKTTYREGTTHFLAGCFIKQEVVLHILKKLPLNTYFLFTDVDCVITKEAGLYDFFKGYMDKEIDMAYMWEGSSSSNIGVSLLRVNEKTIAFYESVLKKSRENPTMVDQNIIVSLLPEFRGQVAHFDKSVLCLSNYYAETEPKSGILLVQVLCCCTPDYKQNMMQKYMGAKTLGVPIERYIQNAIDNGRTPDELGVIMHP